jgi:O-methyltransferase involved in polyketide biosynthesis
MSLHDAEEEDIMRSTNDDATGCRYSMVTKGYMEDECVYYFTRTDRIHELKKSPIIHRGTYARCKSIDNVVEWFIKRPTPYRKQIVSLGAGFDTRYFRFKVHENKPI